jgi:integrase
MKAITIASTNKQALLPQNLNPSKDRKHRIEVYAEWLDANKFQWQLPDLGAYRDYLLHEYVGGRGKGLSNNSVSSHLSTIRGRYEDIVSDNRTRDMLYLLTPQDGTPADRKAVVDEIITRLENATNPRHFSVKVVQKRDVSDTEHTRLTVAQAKELLSAPGTDTLMGLRDTAILALMLCTGIREAELVALDVEDLRQRLSGELALQVREGKGAVQRLIPYGELSFALAIVEAWLLHAAISEGAVFRGFWKGGKRVRDGGLTTRAINKILDKYPVSIESVPTIIHPHDLRRTYARLSYEAGTPIMALKDNLGHSHHKTTERYIGAADVDDRKGKGFLSVTAQVVGVVEVVS